MIPCAFVSFNMPYNSNEFKAANAVIKLSGLFKH